ncbi:HIT-like protein [Amniculicola lignicola CBS 123094]|uniref:HIT-like protein n=1 Tax=Amniculicola lignicola CBS 123094 TaxID=1392246 RepID=A0A6A5X079_9PLEO|nr:HIT-like protein [Amniculicola lignicola CBS 123094]
MNELDLHYPPDACPFCNIAGAFPYTPTTSLENGDGMGNGKGVGKGETLSDCVPSETDADPEKTDPNSFVVLAARDTLAFLDILPMVRGHLLVSTRQHRVKVADMHGDEGRDIGMCFWLPVIARAVCKVTGVTDYNIVQNNGARAAQVVPHVHFHIIPRPETMPEIKNKSWTMFGRGQRDELMDEDGASIAVEMRKALREEIAKIGTSSKL